MTNKATKELKAHVNFSETKRYPRPESVTDRFRAQVRSLKERV